MEKLIAVLKEYFKYGLSRVNIRKKIELVSELFLEEIRYYPLWIKSDKSRIPSLVANIEEASPAQITFSIHENKYLFIYEIKKYDKAVGGLPGRLELYANNKKVFGISGVLTYLDSYTYWASFNIEYFINGDWIKGFEELEKYYRAISKLTK